MLLDSRESLILFFPVQYPNGLGGSSNSLEKNSTSNHEPQKPYRSQRLRKKLASKNMERVVFFHYYVVGNDLLLGNVNGLFCLFRGANISCWFINSNPTVPDDLDFSVVFSVVIHPRNSWQTNHGHRPTIDFMKLRDIDFLEPCI